ncbi:MAG: hypothetical protein MZV63_57740 [Marinilabiliales bacterium]|nr:hypothetical protein [Marinilabiliales bacterium]
MPSRSSAFVSFREFPLGDCFEVELHGGQGCLEGMGDGLEDMYLGPQEGELPLVEDEECIDPCKDEGETGSKPRL